jgi:Ran GTPase-activating protein (RanGAP) involved in mRNA processing and transport
MRKMAKVHARLQRCYYIDSEYACLLAYVLAHNRNVQHLDLSSNNLDEFAGQSIGLALGMNSCLLVLNS